MFKKFFKKKKKETLQNKNILVAALLIHAAKIDENYTDIEKKMKRKVGIAFFIFLTLIFHVLQNPKQYLSINPPLAPA